MLHNLAGNQRLLLNGSDSAHARSSKGFFLRKVFIALICLAGCWLGLALREWQWSAAASIHSASDMDNAMHWGRLASRIGYVNTYPFVVRVAYGHTYLLDYAPARLAVFELWAS